MVHRVSHGSFSGFLSHYVIRDRYARPGKGNEKGNVEGLVGYCRRNFMVPIPKFPTWEAFNLWLEDQCRKRQQDKVRGESETIGERLQRDLAAMQPLPATPFDRHVARRQQRRSCVSLCCRASSCRVQGL